MREPRSRLIIITYGFKYTSGSSGTRYAGYILPVSGVLAPYPDIGWTGSCHGSKKPPIKVVSPGKVFRSDDDATHSPMFSQMEGLVVDEGITLCDLKGMLDMFVQRIFGEQTKTRLRPSYFPFTEPSVEVDVSCFQCGGKGCRLCKETGWIEVLGAGVVNKKVLENCGIDSNKYSGFAFGLGLERIAMLKYGINNIKMLFESDLRVLDQIDD